MIVLTIYSRPGCHLCEEMKAAIARVTASSGIAASVEEIDVSTDPDLERRFGAEIPVLLVNGKKAAKYRLRDEELGRLIDAVRETGQARG
jgi:hypothetical protein